MFLRSFEITPTTTVSDIVLQDYRTADVFHKYGIEYCCTGWWPLEIACTIKGLEVERLTKELENITRTVQASSALFFQTWETDFLIDFIIHVHHHYLEQSLPRTAAMIKHFVDEHEKKYPHMQEVNTLFIQLIAEIFPHIRQEEEVVFPYIRQMVHAYENKDSYGKLLVKTLRKPVDIMMLHEKGLISLLLSLRDITNQYTPPESACVSYKVTLCRMKELDNDLMQHIYLENEILFPRALKIEQELLNDKSLSTSLP